MNNTRFATAIHILTILAADKDAWLNSDYIAGSINVNPVIVRKELIVLQQAGLVESRKGKDGGARLSKSPRQITLTDIYKAVKNSDILGKKNLNTNPKCPVGKNINNRLETLYSETDLLVVNFLQNKTLEEFAGMFQ
ncbi:Rrf2 family transcriptional regulator [Polluticaenibacter yanchengensis]|uniref:Rrf2 family transcriptional regulator n=1 Tax=Polluticaenibacter yanchengensis TaxID=3014562 RepID=A0ABT4UPI5_9BACT|nr:Rrf2 family transcriptional regulator [Chitinophagaceae bacterium LY-5]